MKSSKFVTMAHPQKQHPTDHSKQATQSSTLKSKPTTRSVLKGQNQTKNGEELRKHDGKSAYQTIMQGNYQEPLKAEDKTAKIADGQRKESTDKTHKHKNGNDEATHTKEEDDYEQDKLKQNTNKSAHNDALDYSATDTMGKANAATETEAASDENSYDDEDEEDAADKDDDDEEYDEDAADTAQARKITPPEQSEADRY
jgi:hypothetical protein